MQGIAALAPNMAPPSPQAQPEANLPPEIANQVNQAFGGMSPDQTAQFEQLAQELNSFLPEELQALLDILNYLRQNKDRYPEAVQELVAQGRIQADDVPPEFNPVYFSVLFNVIKQKIMEKQGAAQNQPPAFAQGGLASLAQTMSAAGRNGDNMLVHITPTEMRYLERVSGPPSVNPVTGLPEYSFLGSVGNFLKKAATVVLPIALSFTPLGPIAGAAVGSGLASLINGGKPADALKSALIGGAAGAVLSGISGSLSADSAFRPFLPDVGSAAGQGFMAGVQAGLPGGLGLSGQYAMDRSWPTWLGGSGEAAKTIAGSEAAAQPSPLQGELPKALSATPDEYAGSTTTTAGTGGTTTPQAPNVTPPGAPSAKAGAMDSIKNFLMPSNPTTADILNSADYKSMVQAGISPSEAFKSVSASMTPGMLAKYGPMAALGVGALMLGGAFKTPNTKRQPIAEGADFQGKTAQQLLADNPSKYQVANLNPYQFVKNDPNFSSRSEVVNSPSYTQVQANQPIQVPNLLDYYYGRATPVYAAKGGIAQTDEYRRMNGHIAGPGTGTSDSIPARLSDGEFVMTAKAVRGAGGGDRIKGAKKMYQLMRELEARG